MWACSTFPARSAAAPARGLRSDDSTGTARPDIEEEQRKQRAGLPAGKWTAPSPPCASGGWAEEGVVHHERRMEGRMVGRGPLPARRACSAKARHRRRLPRERPRKAAEVAVKLLRAEGARRGGRRDSSSSARRASAAGDHTRLTWPQSSRQASLAGSAFIVLPLYRGVGSADRAASPPGTPRPCRDGRARRAAR